MAVFLRGQLWNLGSDGRSLAVTPAGTQLVEEAPGARLFNLWL
jgi:hypothetical protein